MLGAGDDTTARRGCTPLFEVQEEVVYSVPDKVVFKDYQSFKAGYPVTRRLLLRVPEPETPGEGQTRTLELRLPAIHPEVFQIKGKNCVHRRPDPQCLCSGQSRVHAWKWSRERSYCVSCAAGDVIEVEPGGTAVLTVVFLPPDPAVSRHTGADGDGATRRNLQDFLHVRDRASRTVLQVPLRAIFAGSECADHDFFPISVPPLAHLAPRIRWHRPAAPHLSDLPCALALQAAGAPPQQAFPASPAARPGDMDGSAEGGAAGCETRAPTSPKQNLSGLLGEAGALLEACAQPLPRSIGGDGAGSSAGAGASAGAGPFDPEEVAFYKSFLAEASGPPLPRFPDWNGDAEEAGFYMLLLEEQRKVAPIRCPTLQRGSRDRGRCQSGDGSSQLTRPARRFCCSEFRVERGSELSLRAMGRHARPRRRRHAPAPRRGW
jgi:hypothetical protein